MKFGSSRTSGLSVRTHSPLDKADGLVLGGGESDILVVVVDPALILELLEDVDGTVGRRVVDDDDFQIRVLLFQAPIPGSA